jgi:hypothetical protein
VARISPRSVNKAVHREPVSSPEVSFLWAANGEWLRQVIVFASPLQDFVDDH